MHELNPNFSFSINQSHQIPKPLKKFFPLPRFPLLHVLLYLSLSHSGITHYYLRPFFFFFSSAPPSSFICFFFSFPLYVLLFILPSSTHINHLPFFFLFSCSLLLLLLVHTTTIFTAYLFRFFFFSHQLLGQSHWGTGAVRTTSGGDNFNFDTPTAMVSFNTNWDKFSINPCSLYLIITFHCWGCSLSFLIPSHSVLSYYNYGCCSFWLILLGAQPFLTCINCTHIHTQAMFIF